MGDIDAVGRLQSKRRLDVRRFRGGELRVADDPDLVATEEPFEIRLGYSRRDGSRAEEPVSVTMRTPGHDEDLAVGFLFTEGIIRARSDVQEVVARGQRAADGLINVVRVELTPGVPVDFKRLERNFYMTSSCGVCGKASIEAVAVQGQHDVGAMNFKTTGAALGTANEPDGAECHRDEDQKLVPSAGVGKHDVYLSPLIRPPGSRGPTRSCAKPTPKR